MLRKPYKIQHSLKVLEKSGVQGTYINIIRTTDSKSIANIKLNREKLRTIPPKLGTGRDCSFPIYSI